jgi:dTDP-4-dehydrorhamnose reductase
LKVLICGAGGQLGTELNRILGEGAAEIGPIPEIYEDAKVILTGSNDLDITSASTLDAFIQQGQFDLIINCAAMTNVDGCEENEELAYKINAEGAANLARSAEKCGAKLIHISTDYVFDGETPNARIESDSTSPQSAYGRTKLAGENFVTELCAKHFIVRTAWLYGYRGSNFVKTMLNLARQHGSIKVVNDQYGNPTSANDLAYELLKIAQTENYGIYHCTNNGTCTWYDFASEIVDLARIPCDKTPCSTEEFPRPAKRPAYSGLQNKKLEDTIGDEMRPWKDALVTYLNNLEKLEGTI